MNGHGILIVEDNYHDAKLLAAHLTRRLPEFHVTHAYSSREARDIVAKTKQFRLVCLDLHLPDDPDGINTLQFLRDAIPHAILAIVSGCIEESQRGRLYALGGMYICKKDFSPGDLEPIISMLSVSQAAWKRGRKTLSWRTSACGAVMVAFGVMVWWKNKETMVAMGMIATGFGLFVGADSSVVKRLTLPREEKEK